MVRGRGLTVITRVLPLALVVGVSGLGLAHTAGALTVPTTLPTVPTTLVSVPTTLPTVPTTLPTVPTTLVSVTVSPVAANVAVGAEEQFTATGVYSDLSTRDLTDSVTWSSSASGTATISNTPGSQGRATGIADGVVTITATDPSALVSGTAALTVTPIPAPRTELVAVDVAPAVADVAVGAGEQFTATGVYSDSSTRDLTDTVTWSSSDSTTATVSNAPGSQGLATGIADGVVTITATDPSAVVGGTGLLTVTPVAVPVAPAPPIPQLALTPATGVRKSVVLAHGSGFSPGSPVTVTYGTGLKARKRASAMLCHTTAAANGSFSCRGAIPRGRRAGKRGSHTIKAVGAGATGTSTFTLVRR
jgi:Bacterial Ig-like domain (group 2)